MNDESESDGKEELVRMHFVSADEAAKVGRISEAIKTDNLESVQREVKMQGSSLASFKSHFGTLLHLTASFGTVGLLVELAKSGININIQSSDGSTALHVAAKLGRHDIVESILAMEDVDDTIRDINGMTAAEVAKSRQIVSLFEYARNMHQLKKTKEMHSMVHHDDLVGLQKLFQKPRNLYLLDVNAMDSAGDAPLHVATKHNNLDMVALCIKLGADPYLKNKKGKLPIELCKDESVKAMLKEAPMVQPKDLTIDNPNIKLEGQLSKWANYAEGYKKRWFVLEDGLLSYYKSQADYPVNCRGSLNVQFCRVFEHPNDKHRFEIIGLNNSIRFHLRADSIIDAKKWVIAMNEAHRSMISETKSSLASFPSPAFPTLGSKPFSESQDVSPMRKLLEDCYAVLSASETNLLSVCDLADTIGNTHEDLKSLQSYVKEETALHRKMSKLLSAIEDLETSRENESSSLKQQLEALETTVKEYAEEQNKIEKLSLQSQEEQDTESQTLAEEFYDAVEVVEESVEEQSYDDKPSKNGHFMVCPGMTMIPRQVIPCDSSSMPPVNLWSILKGLIGKDLFRFPLPVNFAEPLSMLQRLAEDVEYAELLDKAAGERDPLLRIQYVAAFAVSCYSSTENRMTKPFNPLLGETFEYIDESRQFRYLAEQVSHHPPISACHCEGKDWVYWSEVNVTNRFLGKSLDISPEGWNHVVIKSTGDHYVWKKVQMSIYNLIVGKLWIDHYGMMTVENKCNGMEKCELEFKAHGWRGTNAKRVVGHAYSHGFSEPAFSIDGHWNSALVSRNLRTGKATDLWRRRPLPPNAHLMYMFTRFAMTLNQLEPSMIPLLCPTDSRFRPDQRAMEEGKWEEANRLKADLEEKQRTTKKLLASQPDSVYKPRWFKKDNCPQTGETQWTYVGEYWESRELSDWARVNNIPNIYL